MIKQACPCGSGLDYDQCCKPLHTGKRPENALELMRSRYSAYVLNLADYIIETTHPASPQYSENKFSWKRQILQFSKNFTFKKLEILDFKEKEPIATVVFTCHIFQGEEDSTFTEKSYFEKVNNRWLYKGGQLRNGHAPNLVTTEELKLLPLAYYNDAILRKKADPILEITKDIEKLVQEMIETMDASDGVGLAAPQIHHSIRLFVMRMPIENELKNIEMAETKVFINPVLSLPSSETWEAPEGCLSIPTVRASVRRPNEITVEYTTLNGTREKAKFSGWAARIIMHENDHLNGVLFIDRLSHEDKEKLKPILEHLNQRIHDGKAL